MDIERLMSENAAKKPASRRASSVTANVDFSKLIRMGFNEHPYGMSPKALKIMQEETAKSNLYGDFGKKELKEALAKFYGLGVENVTASAGSSPLIETIGCAFLNPGDEVLMCPTFAAFIDMAQIRQAVPVIVPLNEDMTYDLDGLYNAITEKTKIIVLCNPNNPTGTYVGKEKVLDFIKKVPDNIIVLMDEAYLEFATAPDCESMYPLIKEFPDKPIIVLKTFSKYYGMAGIRVGYALAAPELIAAIDKCPGVMISRAGLAGAVAALDDQEYYQDVKKKIVEGMTYLETEMEALGCKVYHSQTNFIFFDPHMDAQLVRTKLMEAGIMISAPSICRVSVGTMENNRLFISKLKKIMSTQQ